MSRCFFKIFGDSYWRELKKNSVTTIIHFLQLILIWVWNINETYVRSSHRRCSVRKGVLRNFVKFTGKHLCQSLFFDKVRGLRQACNFIKKRLAQMFSCKFYEISRNTFSKEHLCWLFLTRKTYKDLMCSERTLIILLHHVPFFNYSYKKREKKKKARKTKKETYLNKQEKFCEWK